MKIKLTDTRLAFPVLFEAKTVNGEGKPAFAAAFLLDPTDPQVKALNQAIEAVAKEKWGAKADAIIKQMRAQDKTCLHDGDLKSNYDGFPGSLYRPRPVQTGLCPRLRHPPRGCRQAAAADRQGHGADAGV